MHTHKISAVKSRMLAMFAVILSVGLLIPSAHAHHSYAMYDGSVYRVFTGVIVRVIPNAAHFEFHFVPLNEKRDALVRDEKGEPLVWVVQMESAGEALKQGITLESFQGVPSSAWESIHGGMVNRPETEESRVYSNAPKVASPNQVCIATPSRAANPLGRACCRRRLRSRRSNLNYREGMQSRPGGSPSRYRAYSACRRHL